MKPDIAPKIRFFGSILCAIVLATGPAHAYWNKIRHNLRDYEIPVHFQHVIKHQSTNQYLAGGRFGGAFVSQDLRTWAPVDLGTSSDVDAIAQDNNGHILALAGGELLDFRYDPATPPIHLGYGGAHELSWIPDQAPAGHEGRFFRVGGADPASVAWSTDGGTWVPGVVEPYVYKPQWDNQGKTVWGGNGEPVIGTTYADWVDDEGVSHRAETGILPISLLLQSDPKMRWKGTWALAPVWNGSMYVIPVVSHYGLYGDDNPETQHYFNFILLSRDGETWKRWWVDDTISMIGGRYHWSDMAANPLSGRFVALDQDRIWLSDNGLDWREVYSYAFEGPALIEYDNSHFFRVAFANAQWWALGAGGLFVESKDHGETWVSRAQHGPYIPREILRTMADDAWVIFGDGGDILLDSPVDQSGQPLTEVWWKWWPTNLPTEVEHVPAGGGHEVLPVVTETMASGWVEGARRYLAVGSQGLSSWSDDGTAWSWNSQHILQHPIHGTDFLNGQFLLFGDSLSGSSFVGLSTTGDAWSFPANVGLSCVGVKKATTCYPDFNTPESCVVDGDTGATLPAVLERVDLYDGVYVQGMYYAVGADGLVLQSPNARDWRVVRWPTYDPDTMALAKCNSFGPGLLRSVLFDGAEMVAAGESGWVVMKPNTWNPQERPWVTAWGTGMGLQYVRYGDNHYVGFTADGHLWVSPNARSWFSQGYPFGAASASKAELVYEKPAWGSAQDAARWIATREVTGTMPTLPPAKPVVLVSEDLLYWQNMTPTSVSVDNLHDVLIGDSGWELFGDGMMFEQSPYPVPYALPDNWRTVTDTPVDVRPPGVLSNDIFPGGGASQGASVVDTSQAHGTVSFAADGSFVYVPDPGFVGTARFSYHVANDYDVSNDTPVTIEVQPTGFAPPVALGEQYWVSPDVSLTLHAPGILSNDYYATSPSDRTYEGLSVQVLTNLADLEGEVSVSGTGEVQYRAPATFQGDEHIEYRVMHEGVLSSPAEMVIHVNTGQMAPPVAEPDHWETGVGQMISMMAPGVLANDWQLDAAGQHLEGATLPASVVVQLEDSSQAQGRVFLNPDGSFTYEPAANFEGVGRFSYSLQDGMQSSAPTWVEIDVKTGSSAPPMTLEDSATTAPEVPVEVAAPGVLANDTHVQGATVNWDVTGLPAGGQWSALGQGGFRYVPPANSEGEYIVFYQATVGAQSSLWTPLNLHVVASATTKAIAREDHWQVGPGQVLILNAPGVLDNDSAWDAQTGHEVTPDEAPGSFSVQWDDSIGGPGTLTTESSGAMHYEAPTNWVGTLVLSYRCAYNGALSMPAQVMIDVGTQARPLPPAGVADSFRTGVDLALKVTGRGVLTNDSEPADGVQWVDQGPVPGTFVGDSGGGFIYTPRVGWEGQIEVWYRPMYAGLTGPAVPVTLEVVSGAVPPPVAVEDVGWVTDINTPLELSEVGVIANDWALGADGAQINGSALQPNYEVELVDASSVLGDLDLHPNGSLTYAPADEFEGTEEFWYRLVSKSDATQMSSPVRATIHVSEGVTPSVDPETEPSDPSQGDQDAGGGATTDPIQDLVDTIAQNSSSNSEANPRGSCFISTISGGQSSSESQGGVQGLVLTMGILLAGGVWKSKRNNQQKGQ